VVEKIRLTNKNNDLTLGATASTLQAEETDGVGSESKWHGTQLTKKRRNWSAQEEFALDIFFHRTTHWNGRAINISLMLDFRAVGGVCAPFNSGVMRLFYKRRFL
jgi:hypothetical protein